MPERVLIELDGSTPKFRVSKPGKSVFFTDLSDFLIREDIECYRGALNGSRSFTGAGQTDVSVSAIVPPVYVSLRSSDELPPTHGTYYVWIINNTTMRIFNADGVARTIYYSVFGNRIA